MKPEGDLEIEDRYFRKYAEIVGQELFINMWTKATESEYLYTFEPFRNYFVKNERKLAYSAIDESSILSDKEKLEAMIGLTMIMEGVLPESSVISTLGNVFGEKFVGSVERKRTKAQEKAVISKLKKYVEWKFDKPGKEMK